MNKKTGAGVVLTDKLCTGTATHIPNNRIRVGKGKTRNRDMFGKNVVCVFARASVKYVRV